MNYLKTIITQLFINLDYKLKHTTLKLARVLLFKKNLNHAKINRILVFRTGSLGDSICTLPAMESLWHQYPKAKIDLLTHSGGKGLVSIKNLIHQSAINSFIFYQEKSFRNLVLELRPNNYDLFILFPQAHASFRTIFRNLLFARLTGAKHTIGFEICVTRLFPQTQALKYTIPNVREFFLNLLKKEGIVTNPYMNQFSILPAMEDDEKINALLVQHNLSDTTKNIALVVGAKRPQNRWPLTYFDKVIEFLSCNNYNCILVGGPEDTEIAKQLKNYSHTTDFTGQLSPVQSGLVFSRCVLSVTNDTGPMHLAYAFGCKVLALFSSRDYPNLWFPPVKGSSVFRNNSIHCSECFTETCMDNQCMKQILPEIVIKKIQEELNL